MKLIIAEKPSVARDLARVLGAKTKRTGHIEGNGYKISWCFGHMVQLAEPARYDAAWKSWTASSLPMLPEQFKLLGIESSKDQLKHLKSLLHDAAVTTVINACDAGREGELIFRYVYDLLRCKKPVERLWLASMTDAAIKQGFQHLRPGTEYDALADAARCRSEADWLVGLNATRAMTIRCRQAGAGKDLMSIGRVQTPTLAILVDREAEIEAFVPEDFWQLYATFDAGEQPEGIEPTYEGLWTKKKVNRFETKAEAEAVVKAIKGQPARVSKVEHKEIRERPPQLFDLTSLQREANRRFGYSAQQTLDIAQTLYEKHKLITYPRTDSNYLTKDMKKGLPNVLKAVNIDPYDTFCDHLLANLPLKVTRRIVNDAEVGDHHAIIPTDRTPDLSRLSRQDELIYDLIVRRFIAAFYPDAIFATTKIATTVASHHFLTTGKVRREAGWQEVMPPTKAAAAASKKKKKGGKKSEEETPILPDVKKGDDVTLVKQRIHKGTTQPPRRYSESALLGAMERAGNDLEDDELRRAMKESGLGTPATRASIIETLLRRDYIERKGKTLVPQARGRMLIDALPTEDLKSAHLTGAWEARLTAVANDKLSRGDFMAQVRKLTEKLTHELLHQKLDIPQHIIDANRPTPQGEILGHCPICKEPVRESPGGKAYSCDTGRSCSFVIFKQVARRNISKTTVKTLLSGKTTDPLKNFKSKQNKPFEASLRLDEQGKVTFVFDNSGYSSSPPSEPRRQSASPPAKAKSPAPNTAKQQNKPRKIKKMKLACPKCDEGTILRGRSGWGCSNWKSGCDFVIAFEQCGVTLDDEQGADLLRLGEIGPLDALQGAKLVLDLEREGNIHYVAPS